MQFSVEKTSLDSKLLDSFRILNHTMHVNFATDDANHFTIYYAMVM